ncbi:hypothetical protein ACJX0J_010950, partial [Zea mays]
FDTREGVTSCFHIQIIKAAASSCCSCTNLVAINSTPEFLLELKCIVISMETLGSTSTTIERPQVLIALVQIQHTCGTGQYLFLSLKHNTDITEIVQNGK